MKQQFNGWGISFLCLALAAVASADAPSTRPASLFDPARHMHVSEVRPGMTGYGISVFHGHELERFDVKVLSILKNFNPKTDVILIECHGANLEHTGSIAGMSGSPIYLKDDAGRYRLIGAFAYGWPLMKDPVAGVQPIEYMLQLQEPKDIDELMGLKPSKVEGTDGAQGDKGAAQGRSGVVWHAWDSMLLPGMHEAPAGFPLATWGELRPNPRLGVDDADVEKMQPLATPLMAAGLPPTVLEQFGPLLKAYGLLPMQAGGMIAGGSSSGEGQIKFEPGSVLAVPLLVGDVDMTAIGTCTEVIGDRMFGFGHAFNSEGPIALPMGTGEIQGVIANLMTSFKLGSLGQVSGTLNSDETVGVAGRIGAKPPMVPIDLRILYEDGSLDKSYHFEAASHPRFTPLLCSVAVASAVTGARELPQYHTLDYDLDVQFRNGKSIRVQNTAVNSSAAEIFFEVGSPMIAASENPFERVFVEKVSGTVHVRPGAREAEILSVTVPRLKYRPGETVKAYLSYRPFRLGEMTLPLDFELPRDLAEGEYQLEVSDWQKFLDDERTAKPFRFMAQNINQVFDVLRDLANVRHNAVYMRLVRQPDGVAVARTAMPYLPSSRRQILMGAGRSDTTAFVSTAIKVIPTELVMDGSAEFTVTIDQDAKLNTPAGTPAKPKMPTAAAAAAAAKAEEKPKGGDKGSPGGGSKPDAPGGSDNNPDHG